MHLSKIVRVSCLAWSAAVVSILPGRSETAWPLPTTTPTAAGFAEERLDKLHANLRRNVDDGKYSGYVVLLARDGKILDWRSHGWQDIESERPMQKDSIVKLFSMSKIVTSVAVLMLLEDGRLRLTDTVETHLPPLKDRKVLTGGTADAPTLVDAKQKTTIRDLLTHTAGYYYDEAWSADPVPMELMKRAKIWESANLDEFVQRVAQVPLHEQPGTRFRYGISTDLLGAVVEKVSGQDLETFFQQRVCSPLGLRDTTFVVPAEKRARVAKIYQRDSNGKLVLDPVPLLKSAFTAPITEAVHELGGKDRPLYSGGGGLYSTAADFARFGQMLLNGGQLDGVRVLSRKTVELMTRNHLGHLASPYPSPSLGFGLGVGVVTDLGQSASLGTEGAFGWDGAATTNVQIDPKERTVAIVLFQHFPYNEDDILATFTNGYYSAFAD